MNEKLFKRLQDQCWIYHTHPDMINTDSNGDARPCGFDTKKFAELLIQECANLNFRGTGFVTGEGEDMVRSMIKQHFGVKE